MNNQKYIDRFKDKKLELKNDADFQHGETQMHEFGYRVKHGNEVFTVIDWENLETFISTLIDEAKSEAMIRELSHWASFFDDSSMNAITPSDRLRRRIEELKEA